MTYGNISQVIDLSGE